VSGDKVGKSDYTPFTKTEVAQPGEWRWLSVIFITVAADDHNAHGQPRFQVDANVERFWLRVLD